MNKKYREAKRDLDQRYNEELYRVLREHRVCVRCRNDSRPLVSQTMCAHCVETMREYQRKYWHVRVARGTATRGV